MKLFDPHLNELAKLEANYQGEVKVLALTATASISLRIEVDRLLGMRNEVVSISPCKQNIIILHCPLLPLKTPSSPSLIT